MAKAENGGDDPGTERAVNRRAFPRVSLTEAIKIELPDAPGSEARYGTTTDLSRGGLVARVDELLEEKGRCVVRFLSNARVKPTLVWGTVMSAAKEGEHLLVRIEFDTPLEELRLITAPRVAAEPRIDVLVADDESAIQLTVRRFLRRSGYAVRLAADGLEALRALEQRVPDVFLLDLYMPGLNGLEVLCRMKDQSLRPRVVLTISGEHDDASARESLSLGAHDFLVKPLDFDYLDWAIKLRL